MTQREHSLPSGYERLEDRITSPVIDSIVVSARSHVRLHMPGEFSDASKPPRHDVKIVSTDSNNQSVHVEEKDLGTADHYHVVFDVWNYRDISAFAELIQISEG